MGGADRAGCWLVLEHGIACIGASKSGGQGTGMQGMNSFAEPLQAHGQACHNSALGFSGYTSLAVSCVDALPQEHFHHHSLIILSPVLTVGIYKVPAARACTPTNISTHSKARRPCPKSSTV